MPYHRHIESAGIAHTLSARAHRSATIIRCRFPRDVRRRSMMPSPSGESMAASVPRERGGVPERDVRRRRVDHHPSGESEVASFSRDQVDVPERELWSGDVDRHPFRESTSTCTGCYVHLRAFPQPTPMIFSGTTSRIVQPATSRCVGGVNHSLNPHREFVFRSSW